VEASSLGFESPLDFLFNRFASAERNGHSTHIEIL
jgi:hypothetical protein